MTPPEIVITRKISLANREGMKKQASKCSGKKKRAGMEQLVEEEEKGKGAGGKEMCDEGDEEVGNKKATAKGLSRTVH